MAVQVKGFKGVAFEVLGPVKVWEPFTCLVTYEDGTEREEETVEGEWVDGDGSRLQVRMVGDDRVHEVAAEDCTPLPDEDYCGSCGQIGCGHA